LAPNPSIFPNQLPPADSGASSISLSALVASVRKHWLIVVIVTIVVGLASAFYTMGQTRVYQAQGTILFDQPLRPLGKEVQTVVDMSGDYLNKKEYYKTQYWVIQSQRLSIGVVQQLGLQRDAAFLTNSPPGAKLPPYSVPVEDAARRLRYRLEVEPIRDSALATVSFSDADPARAQRILGTLMDLYVQSNLDDALDAMNVAGDWLGNQVQSLKTELEASEMALHDYKKDKNILSVSMDDQYNMLRGEIQQLNASLTTNRAAREQIAARRGELLKINPEDPSSVPATDLFNDPLLARLRSDYIAATTQKEVLLASGKGTSHPQVAAAQAQVDTTKTALLDEVRNVQGAVDHDFNVASRTVAGLTGLLEDAKQRALELNLLEIEYNRMARAKENNEKLYGIVTERSKENDLTRMLRFNNIHIVDRPILPRRPISPNVPLNIGSGIALGLALGLIGAIGREQLDRTLKTPDETERELGLPFLGLLPLLDTHVAPRKPYGRSRRRRDPVEPPPDKDVPPELMVHVRPTSGLAEAARAVRTNVLFMSPDKPYRTLLVTSAAPGEGKTTVACCLAVAISQAGKSVILVDCDMRRPRVHRIFGLDNDIGVTTAILDADSLTATVRPTSVPSLSVLTTGPIPPNPAEILHSDAFERLLANLQERFDAVIIDSPPIAPVTDAAVLSKRVDGTILVVRAFGTRKDVARRAVRALRDVGSNIVGTILNAVNFEERGYGGYYQYYYYRKAGYGPDRVPPAKSSPDAST
jgi:capsular exopolysaccharide synthesis family protein